MTTINVETKLIALLGYPLAHSFSPVMHNKGFKTLGLNYFYFPVEVKEPDLGDVVRGISKMNFAGFNVTKPHKINVIKYLDELDDLAKIIGAVNTVTIRNGTLKGYNTDGIGFIRSLEIEKGVTVEGKNIFILGSGGAARAIALTSAYRGAKKVFVCNRTYEKAVELTAEINQKVRLCSYPLAMNSESMKEALREANILVNTTSVGMYPYEDKTPLDKNVLHNNMIICDIVYNPVKTRLLKEAEEAGCKTLNGLGMLLYQGTEGFKLWTGQEAPTEVMHMVLNKVTQQLKEDD